MGKKGKRKHQLFSNRHMSANYNFTSFFISFPLYIAFFKMLLCPILLDNVDIDEIYRGKALL